METKKKQTGIYDGWSNYQTSAVAYWLDNDEATRKFWREQAKKQKDVAAHREPVQRNAMTAETAAVYYLADQIKTAILESNPLQSRPSMYGDLLAYVIADVCFEEVAESWLRELDVIDDYIHSYTRQNAIQDGVLIDVTETAKEAGIKYPTALTRAVWSTYVKVPEDVEHQDESGRLWDALWMFRHAAKQNTDNVLEYQLLVANDNNSPKLVTLKAVCGPGDNMDPVITIMLPDED